MNRDLFGGNPRMVRDEKARTDFFLDHLTVGSPTRDDIRRLMDVDRMGKSLRHYALGQVERTTFEAEKPRLIAIDNYARHELRRVAGARQGLEALGPSRLTVRDREALEREFRDVKTPDVRRVARGPRPAHRGLSSRTVTFRCSTSTSPSRIYRKLEPRLDFRRLGQELEKALPHVYAGDVHDAELDPDDMGSCGPGQTLHFTGPTYRKMIQVALEKGLAEWLTPTSTAVPS